MIFIISWSREGRLDTWTPSWIRASWDSFLLRLIATNVKAHHPEVSPCTQSKHTELHSIVPSNITATPRGQRGAHAARLEPAAAGKHHFGEDQCAPSVRRVSRKRTKALCRARYYAGPSAHKAHLDTYPATLVLGPIRPEPSQTARAALGCVTKAGSCLMPPKNAREQGGGCDWRAE